MKSYAFEFVSTITFLFFGILLQAQPNILLIISDDLGTDATNGYIQSPDMPTTPNLDGLMANGLKFTNTWAAPICTPTRSAIMSGKYGIKTGVMGVPGTLDTTHTSLFRRMNALACDNYAKAVIGKWHLSSPADPNHPADHGVDHFEGILLGAVNDYFNWTKVTNGVSSQQTDYVTTNFTDGAINWINNQNQPWFLWLSHVAPHSPYHVPPAHMYTRTNTASNTDKFLAMVESMDYEIGRLLGNIPPDVLENTIIIYIGDNGTPNPVLQSFPNGRGKGSLYQGGVGVPMFISGYGVSRKGETEDALTHVVDIHATILNMAGGNLVNGINNSLPMDSLFVPNETTTRLYNYSEATNNMNPARSGWTIRNQRFKLLDFDNGTQEFYNLMNDPFENNNLIGNLNNNQTNAKNRMEIEAAAIQNGWSCQDYIQNGDEDNRDCGGTYCTPCVTTTCPNNNQTSTTNNGCCVTPAIASFYFESIVNGKRKILTNNFPNHDYCHTAQNVPTPKYYTFEVDPNPVLNNYKTSIKATNNRPDYFYGVALNSIIMAPAPATPFIFENPNTGQYNWDWVMEPTNTQGNNSIPGGPWVQLDCSSAHSGNQGYHYHGNMFEYAESIQAGLSTTTTPPTAPIQVGWAADGFPILYRFGPDGNGGMALLQPSYELKSGYRPGNGITAPCGLFNGRYTNDYQYSCEIGDLDECNGIERSVTITTTQGSETFDYFYVITASFPQIPRCHSGERDVSFDNSNSGGSGVPHPLPPGDLAPTLKVVPSTLQGVSAMNIVVKVSEVSLRDTDGSTITVRVPIDPRMTFTWDPSLTNVGFDQVQNSQWTYSSNTLFHTFETNNVIAGGANLSFGYVSTYDPQNTSGQSTITMTIVPTSGGETQYNNNADAELMTYFN